MKHLTVLLIVIAVSGCLQPSTGADEPGPRLATGGKPQSVTLELVECETMWAIFSVPAEQVQQQAPEGYTVSQSAGIASLSLVTVECQQAIVNASMVIDDFSWAFTTIPVAAANGTQYQWIPEVLTDSESIKKLLDWLDWPTRVANFSHVGPILAFDARLEVASSHQAISVDWNHGVPDQDFTQTGPWNELWLAGIDDISIWRSKTRGGDLDYVRGTGLVQYDGGFVGGVVSGPKASTTTELQNHAVIEFVAKV